MGSLSGSAGAIVTNSYSPAYLDVDGGPVLRLTTTFAGNIISNNALAISGSGELTLSGTNTYTGGTTVSGGTLDIAAPSALSGSGLVTIAAGGRLVLGSGAGIGACLRPRRRSVRTRLPSARRRRPRRRSADMKRIWKHGDARRRSPTRRKAAAGTLWLLAAAVPEPGTIALLAAAAVGLIAWAWRRREAT